VLHPADAVERLLAPLRSQPVYGAVPAKRKQSSRLSALLQSLILLPFSLAGRLIFLFNGRSARLKSANVKRIVFVKLDHIGDAVMASPILRALHEWAPSAEITVVARPQSAEYFRLLPGVSRVAVADVPWIRPNSPSFTNLRACLALARKIRAGRYDLAVDLRYHNRLDSLALSLCGARWRLGFNTGNMGFGLTHRAGRPRKGHEIVRMARALAGAGIPVKSLDTMFPISPALARAVSRKLGAIRGKKLVAFHPGAGNAIKRWMPERFAEVARELVRRSAIRLVLLGGPGESALGEGIARAAGRRALIDLRGKLSLARMAGVLERCNLFIGNDGGPAHVAGAVGTPSLVVFSGTSIAADWAPRGKRVRIIEKTVPCKPCYSTTCPFGQACLRAVSVDEVAGLAGRMLRGR